MYYLELAGEDDRLAIAEAALAGDGLDRLAPGIASAEAVDPERATRLAQTRSVLEAVASVGGALDALERAVADAPLGREGTVAVRARAVRGAVATDTPTVERRIGRVLVDRGFAVDLDDPDHVLRILATDGREPTWFAGWVVAAPPRSYGTRRPPQRPFKQPGTMRPQLARTLVNLSGVLAGERLLDPMCGAGAILIEAALVGAHPIGVDLQRKMVDGTRTNLEAFAGGGPPPRLVQGSASQLPVCQADAAVFDAPYGRQSPIGYRSAPALLEATLTELAGLVDGCVAVFDRPIDEHAAATGWTVDARFELRVHRSLVRHVAVLHRDR